MKFSIIIPIYNVEKYIHRCIESVINQTYKNIEIVLVDDESPDECPKICDEYAMNDNRVIVVHKQNGGLSDARNAGIKVASGEYLIFLDGDDYIEIDTCQNFYKYTTSKPDVIIGEAIVEGGTIDLSHINSDDELNGEQYLLNAYKAKKAPMAAWLNVFNREFLQSNNLYFKKGILHEDEEFSPRALLAANTIICSGVFFYHYVIREDSITTKKDKRKNAQHLYTTCCELEIIYNKLKNEELKLYLLDSLTEKYLNMFQVGRLYKYGREYYHTEFILRNAKLGYTKKKAFLYSISPRLYFVVNYLSKKL